MPTIRRHLLVAVGALLGSLLVPPLARAQHACEQWAPLATYGQPPGRFGHQLVYDSDRQKFVMFGGENRDAVLGLQQFLNDTWEFDLGTQTWTEFDGGSDPPEPRSHFAMAYDSDHQSVVLYGGVRADPPGPTDEFPRNAYVYDPVAHAWHFGGSLPSHVGLAQAAMAYDPIRHHAVVFGGRDGDQAYDTTVVDLVVQHPAHSPPARIGHTMVWSPTLGGVLLFGGVSFGGPQFGQAFQDLWLWDGTDWTQIGGGPSRYDHGAIWDPLYGKMILFGGVDGGGDTTAEVLFAAPNGKIDSHATTGGPDARGRMGFAWDAARHLAVLFGGKGGDTIYHDTWTFGGRPPTVDVEPNSLESPPCHDDFFTFTPGGIGPLSIRWQRLVNGAPVDLHDNARMFGTTTQQLEIDPVRPSDNGLYRVSVSNDCGTTPSLPFSITVQEGAWIQTTLGPKRENAQMAWDSGRGKVVLFGGFQAPGEDGFGYATENDTWEYDGSTWTRVLPTSVLPGAVPGRQTASMAYDPVRGVTVMFGGFYADDTHQNDRTLSDTWEWNGSTWTQKADGPGPRIKGQMVWDPDRQRIELYGGRVGPSAQANDLWEWDGTAWTPRTPSGGPPTANETATAAYDVAREALVVQTATIASTPVGETWELVDDHWTRVGTTGENSIANGTFVMQYDVGRGHLVGIGLHAVSNDPRELETWGRTTPGAWRRMNVGQLLPSRGSFPMVYDAGRKRMVIQGGRSLTNGAELLETRELTFEGDPLCGVTVCGDGAVDPGEDCDPFTDDDGLCCYHCHFVSPLTPCGAHGRCDDAGQCVVTSCGNGVVDPGEQCDPYATPYDPFVDACCTSNCTFSPAGTSCYQPGDPGVCNASGECVSARCGDGATDSDLEQCDGASKGFAGCCTPTCRRTEHGACAPSCGGGYCVDGGTACQLAQGDPAGCTDATSASGYIGESGGTLATPDGAVALTVPPGVAPGQMYGIGSHYAASAFSIGDGTSLALAARFEPPTTFAPPGATIVLSWPDADGDGVVDGVGVDERAMTLFHDGVVIGTCSTDPGCDRTANRWTFRTASFSEFALAGPPPPACAAFSKPTLVLGKALPPAGDDTLAFAGSLAAPAVSPAPDIAGLGFRFEDAHGSVVDVTIPAGAFTKAAGTGWKVDKKRTKWTWSHRKSGAPSGIVKAIVAVDHETSRLTVRVKGQGGAFAATAPLTVTVTLPGSAACDVARFGTGEHACVAKGKGKKLTCR